MGTKERLRMGLLMAFAVILSLGSICDKKENPSGTDLGEDPYMYGVMSVWDNEVQISSGYTIDFGERVVGGPEKWLKPYFIKNANSWPSFALKYMLWIDNTAASSAPFSIASAYIQWGTDSEKDCFYINNVSYPFTYSALGALKECAFGVKYKPTYEGTHMALIHIQSNDPFKAEVWIWVKGYGYYIKGEEPVETKPWPDTGTGTGGTGRKQ